MRRREFIGLVGGATVAWPLGTLAQQGAKTPRIGILAPGHAEGPDASRSSLNAMIEGLHELGYTEGQNVIFERRFGESNPDRLRQAAAELVARQVDVIVAQGTEAGGHTGQVSTLPLLQIVLDAVQIPVLAAGGIATPRGVVAALEFLGALRPAP